MNMDLSENPEIESDAPVDDKPMIDFQPDKLSVKDWKLEFAETDCGTACTPNGCPGHKTNIPDRLIIGGVPFEINSENYSNKDDFKALVAVGVRLKAMIMTNGGRLAAGDEEKTVTVKLNGQDEAFTGPPIKHEIVTDEGVLLSYETIAEVVRKHDKLERVPLYTIMYHHGAGFETAGTLYPGSKPACVKDGTRIECIVTGNA